VALAVVARRLEGLVDEPRPGAPRKLTDEHIEWVIVSTLETTPTDAIHWSTRSLARALGLNQTAVSRIWRAFGLKPHLTEAFKLSTDPQFIDKVRDIVGLYLNPPQAALVLGVDEKTQIQALDRTAPVLSLLPGTPQRATHDSTRHGTTNRYAALDMASGKVITELTGRHRAIEFRRFLARIDHTVPAELGVHVNCDNSSTHKTPAIQRWLTAHPWFQLQFTPTYSSWLNLVERFIAELTTKWLRRGHPPLSGRTRAVHPNLDRYLERRPQAVVWTKTADQILDSIATYCQRANSPPCHLEPRVAHRAVRRPPAGRRLAPGHHRSDLVGGRAGRRRRARALPGRPDPPLPGCARAPTPGQAAGRGVLVGLAVAHPAQAVPGPALVRGHHRIRPSLPDPARGGRAAASPRVGLLHRGDLAGTGGR
jgi:transposase